VATTASKENVVTIEMLYLIHKDYRTAIDGLSEQIEALTAEVSTLKNATPQPDTPTLIPFRLPPTAPAHPSAPDTSPLALPTAAPTKLWAMVAKMCKKAKTTTATKAAHALAKQNTNNGPQLRKGLTDSERRLIIQRAGEPLSTTALDLRDNINLALDVTYVQTGSLRGNTVTLTTMESIKATSLNSEVGTFIHLIPGTVRVLLDTAVSHA